MATLTLRNVKGSALTHDELDSNFGALDSDITAINTTIAGGVGLGADSVNSLIDARIDSDTFVTLTGDQTIGGVKTFSDSAVFSGPLFGDGSNLTGIESYDSVKVQGQIDSDFPTRELTGLFNVNAPTPFGGEVLVYDSSTSKWVAGTSNARQEFHFTPNAGTTALFGDDKFGTFLQYSADSDQLDIFVNGILLVDSDYTKTDNGTITLDVATSALDEIVVHKYRSFVVAGAEITDLGVNDIVGITVANPQDQQVLVWDSSQQSWVAGNANVRSQYHYTPSDGTTAITGNDKFGDALIYADDDILDVFVNGILLNDSDYTRTSSGTITLDVATDPGDDVRILRFEPTRVGETQGFSSSTTDQLPQGSTNFYFTDSSARAAISVTGDLTYDASTGVIGYIDPSVGDSDNFVTLTGNQTVAGEKTFTDTVDFDNFMSLTGAGGTQYISVNGGLDIQDNTGSLGTLFGINGTTGAINIPRSAVAGTQTASVSGATTLNFSTYQNFVLTLTGATTLSNPTTETVGQSGFITFIQDGTGSRAVSLGSDFETAAAGGLALSSGAAETDMVPYIVIASGRILLGTPQLAFG